MKKLHFIYALILLSFLLVSCGDTKHKFQHVVVKSDRLGVLLDSKEAKVIGDLAKIFYDKEEAPDADPEYFYIIDITTAEGTTRWQYSDKGFIRNIEIDASPIYYMTDFAAFNRAVNIAK